MIIVRLQGGLGNQLFQYALGRHLSLVHQTTLKLDLSSLENSDTQVEPRHYALDHFKIQAQIACEDEIARLCWKQPWSNRVRRKLRFGQPPVIREQQWGTFDETVLRAPTDAYLDGYWQSENYFRNIRSILLDDLQLAAPPKSMNLELATELSAFPTVSIHVRRGDYVSNPKASALHGVLPIDYYTRAINLLNSRGDFRCAVFSDDPDWVREYFPLTNSTVMVSHNADEPWEDLWLMSQCRHHIIANSSFSWWGAWLAADKAQIVIAPKVWFTGAQMRDTVPVSWLRL